MNVTRYISHLALETGYPVMLVTQTINELRAIFAPCEEVNIRVRVDGNLTAFEASI